MSDRHRGKIIRLTKSAGTIRGDDGVFYTFHPQELRGKELKPSAVVEFEAKGNKATRISAARTNATQPGENEQGTKKTKQKPRNKPEVPRPASSLPYDFVPIPTRSDGTLQYPLGAAPVFHDGRYGEKKNRLSGEIQCTLHALTPLLVGNYQFNAKDVEGGTLEGAESEEEGFVALPSSWGAPAFVKKDKKIIEPLRLNIKASCFRGHRSKECSAKAWALCSLLRWSELRSELIPTVHTHASTRQICVSTMLQLSLQNQRRTERGCRSSSQTLTSRKSQAVGSIIIHTWEGSIQRASSRRKRRKTLMMNRGLCFLRTNLGVRPQALKFRQRSYTTIGKRSNTLQILRADTLAPATPI